MISNNSFFSDDLDFEEAEEDSEEEEEEEEDLGEELAGLEAEKKEAEAAMDSLASGVSKMSLKKPSSNNGPPFKQFSMEMTVPFMMNDYVEDDRAEVSVDFLVPNLKNEMFRVKLLNPSVLVLGICVPKEFVRMQRCLDANANGKSGFNKNSHKATSYGQVEEKVFEKYGFADEDNLMGEPMLVKLPFPCDETTLEWETQVCNNEDTQLIDELGSELFHFVLNVEVKAEKKKRVVAKKGGFRRIGSPSARAAAEGDAMADE
mmetsp:Transcript_23631/g.49062  ORF Transcript_23631/g.49062 Transcript_23631/m.49062 type:complete len:261 (-) Transcript_23631:72-854(-)